jgi:hypothetical protein
MIRFKAAVSVIIFVRRSIIAATVSYKHAQSG